MKIDVMDSWAAIIEDDTLRQNSTKPYEVKFTFSEGWEAYAKTAIFEAGPASVIVALTEDRCAIPAECLKHGSVKLRVGIYGVKGEDRKGTVWCHGSSMIIPDATMSMGGSSPLPDDIYSEIMAAIGDLSAAGFEGKTLAEVFKEIKESVCETATDEEVGSMLNGTFGQSSGGTTDPGGETSGNTATDDEVADILKDVFG